MIGSTTPRTNYDISSSVPTSFAFAWAFFDEDDIVAELTLANGTTTTLTLNTDYSVSSPSSTGTLTRLTTWDSTAETLTIYRSTPRTHATDYANGSTMDAETLEADLDRLTGIVQEVEDAASTRALTIPAVDPTTLDMTLPAAASRASHVLAFDANGEPIAADAAGDAVISSFVSPALDDTSKDAFLTSLGIHDSDTITTTPVVVSEIGPSLKAIVVDLDTVGGDAALDITAGATSVPTLLVVSASGTSHSVVVTYKSATTLTIPAGDMVIFAWDGAAWMRPHTGNASTIAGTTPGAQGLVYWANATQADMAADILTDLKTVDGAGSGLDADTVRATTPGARGLTALSQASTLDADTVGGLSISSGSFTPTLSAVANLSGLSGDFLYTKIGDIVTIRGEVIGSVASDATVTQYSITLPVAAVASSDTIGGTGHWTRSGNRGPVSVDQGAGSPFTTILVTWTSSGSGTTGTDFSVSYKV